MLETIKYLLWGRNNPSWDWQANSSTPLEFDLGTNRLGGVGLNDAIDRLSWLGRAPAGSRHTLEFFQHGLQVDVEEGRIVGLVLFVGPSPWREAKMGTYVGKFRHHGSPCEIAGGSLEETLIKRLGPPQDREADDEEIILTYHLQNAVQEFELDAAGRLQVITVFDPN